MGRTPTTIIVNVLPPARSWMCWFRKCVIQVDNVSERKEDQYDDLIGGIGY